MLLLYRALFLLLFILHSTFANSAQPAPATINLNLNITQDQKQSSNAANTNEVNSSLANTNKVERPMNPMLIDFIKELYKTTLTHYNVHQKRCGDFFGNNPLKITIGIFVGCYLYLMYRIEECKKTIYSPDSWCCWSSSMETSELTMTPYSKIYERLIEDIQKKYLIDQATIEFIDSLERFIQDVKIEINRLTFYIQLHKNITRCHAAPAFFLKKTTLLAAEDRLQRVRYMYDTFATWHAKQSMHKGQTDR